MKRWILCAAALLMAVPAQSEIIWEKIDSTHTLKDVKAIYGNQWQRDVGRGFMSWDVNYYGRGLPVKSVDVKLVNTGQTPSDIMAGLTAKYGEPVSDNSHRTSGGGAALYRARPEDWRVVEWRKGNLAVKMSYRPENEVTIDLQYRIVKDEPALSL